MFKILRREFFFYFPTKFFFEKRMNKRVNNIKEKKNIRLTLRLNPQPEDCEESVLTIRLEKLFSLVS